MKGNVRWQVQQLYSSLAAIGASKHAAKSAAYSNGAKTQAEVAKITGIHSYATADAYRDVWRAVGEFARSEYGIRDMEKLTGQHAAAWLESKINDGIARATFDKYAAATSKLEAALNRYSEINEKGNKYDFNLKDVRSLGIKELGTRNHEPRAYADPISMLSRLDSQHSLAANIQLEGGARVKEASQIKAEQLHGIHADKITGEMKGQISVVGKGGKARVIQVSPNTYNNLKNAINASGGVYKAGDYKEYLSSLKHAANETKQDYSGTHGLRWTYAQGRMSELQQNGMSYEESLHQVSNEMGHDRSDITEHYLK